MTVRIVTTGDGTGSAEIHNGLAQRRDRRALPRASRRCGQFRLDASAQITREGVAVDTLAHRVPPPNRSGAKTIVRLLCP